MNNLFNYITFFILSYLFFEDVSFVIKLTFFEIFAQESLSFILASPIT